MNKHAYLIIAHDHFDYLIELLKRLDAEYNDIFIHIDKKSKCDYDELKSVLKLSKVFFSKRINVHWGGFSQIQYEYILLKEATSKRHYSYYHLISGSDIILKNRKYIYDFFEKGDRLEYVHFSESDFVKKVIDRIDYYHFFQNHGKRKKSRLVKKLERESIKIQSKLGIHRVKSIEFVYGGSNWFSITDELARIIVEQWNEWQKVFRYSYCADELFVQSVLMNSDRKDKLSTEGNMRKIDWERGSPYVWRERDFEELMKSDALFARKINYEDQLISMIFELIDKSE